MAGQPTRLPAGRYLSCLDDIHPDQGGQTRATLLRNRLFQAEGDADTTLLSFNPAPDYDQRREALLASGLLLPGTGLLNIFDHYRESGWADASPAEPLPDWHEHQTGEKCRSDGTPWRRSYVLATDGRTYFDYLRPDGTPYLRTPHFVFDRPHTWPDRVQQVSPLGEVVGEFSSLGQWFRRWVRDLTSENEQAFVFVDSRRLVPHLVPMDDPGTFLIYVLHNVHVRGPRRWDSPATRPYQQVMGRIGGMDAMVMLTGRQRDDIAERCGATNNLFVVPNPVEVPPQPEQVRRDPRLTTILARLVPQKRLNHAVTAFAQVLQEVPDARLDVYGEGRSRSDLERQITRLGISDSVSLRGFDPHARQALWRSSALLLTSEFEGYPLSTLESFSAGCPVVSYDVKYGPREQITDGADGFLVPAGDINGLADRVVRLLRSPSLVARMSTAATRKAHAHGAEKFLRDWTAVLRTAVEQEPARVTIDGAELDVTCTETDGCLDLSGSLRPEVRSGGPVPAIGRIELDAVGRDSGTVVRLPAATGRDGDERQVACRIDLADLAGDDPTGGEPAYLRLRLVCANAVWQTRVAHPALRRLRLGGVPNGRDPSPPAVLSRGAPRPRDRTGPRPRRAGARRRPAR